jgi:hypothetical protein
MRFWRLEMSRIETEMYLAGRFNARKKVRGWDYRAPRLSRPSVFFLTQLRAVVRKPFTWSETRFLEETGFLRRDR